VLVLCILIPLRPPTFTLFPYTTLFRSYPDGVTICAVYAKDKTPGRCHHGGVSSEPMNWSWRGHRAKINFDVQVPRGVRFNAMTRSEEHTSELQSLRHLVCRLLLEKKKN